MIEVRKLDLTSFDSIRDFSNLITEQFPKIDVLINNAGIYSGKKRSVTVDGHESTFQTNYLGHFYLTKLLMTRLKESAPSRIINVVSEDFKRGVLDFKNLQGNMNFNNAKAYNNVNLAIMYFTKELSKFLKDTEVTVNAVYPGQTCTNLWRDVFPYGWNLTWMLASPYTYLFWKSSSMGAETSYYCALDRDLEKVSGRYFKDCKEEPFPDLDDAVGRKLWAVSERLLEPKKVSTLNQAAIKKALNDIAEGEAKHPVPIAEGETKNTATENEEGEGADKTDSNKETTTSEKKTSNKKENKKKNDAVKKKNGDVKKTDSDVKKTDVAVKKKNDDVDKESESKKPVEQDEKTAEKSEGSKSNTTNVRNRKVKKKIPVKK